MAPNPTAPNLVLMIENLNKKIDTLSNTVDETQRIIKGTNGTAGILTRMALLEQSVNQLTHKISKEEEKEEEAEDNAKDHIGTPEWIIDKLSVPVLLAFILWFTTAILPQLIAHLGTKP